jgi:hypothetical protein
MKMFISMILALGISAQAIAQNSTVCSNGSVDEVGDSHLMIEILKDKIIVTIYESTSIIPMRVVDIEQEENSLSYLIKEQDFETNGEGDTYQTRLGGRFSLNKSETRVEGHLVINGYERELNLNCQKESGGK